MTVLTCVLVFDHCGFNFHHKFGKIISFLALDLKHSLIFEQMPHGLLVKNIVPKNCVKYLSTLFSKPHEVLEFPINISTAYCQIFSCNLEQGNVV